MMSEVMLMMPGTPAGKILIQRDEESAEKRAVFYYAKLPPDISTRRVLLVDPILASGGSSKAAISTLLKAGVPEENIVFINLLSCQQGIDAVLAEYPKIKIVTAKIDPILTENKYVLPGIGDFGDLYFGTVPSANA
jgi:uracil phosphoribosyltransferase